MQPRNRVSGSILLPVLIFLGSCAAGGGNPTTPATAATAPNTPRQMLFTVEESYAAAINTVNGLIQQGVIKGKPVAQIMAADSFAAAALDQADAMVQLAEQSPTPENQATAAKALAIAQQATEAVITALVAAQQAPTGAGVGGK